MKEAKQQSLGFYFFPKMKGFHIVVRLKDVPGALASVLLLLRDHVNIVNSANYSLGDGNAIWSDFGKSLSKTETGRRLEKQIKRLPAVLECEVKESDHGLLVDSFHSGIEVAPGRPGIVFPIIGLARVYDRIVQTFGSGGETILFEEGLELGKSTGQYLNERLGHGRLDWRFKALLGIYRTYGWGIASLEVEKPRAGFRVRVSDCFECSGMGKDRKACGFVRGHLTGTVSALSGNEFKGEETKCRLRGDSFCEFLLSRKEA